MSDYDMSYLREKLDTINLELLDLMNERAQLVKQIGDVKQRQSMTRFDPIRERDMLNYIMDHNEGPFDTSTIEHLFKEIFKASLDLQEENDNKALLVSRDKKAENTLIKIKDNVIGDGNCHYIMGPCAVESYEQVSTVAKSLNENGVKLMRGGAFKPRTSPYDFQGLGLEGLKILYEVGKKYDLAVVSEIVDPTHIEIASSYLDIIQIGARNMQNFELLKAAGDIDKPILLKRGLSATLSEFMNAAEYIMSRGNDKIILCERGIRTYETATRNTLDISAVPILKQETHLPVMVDITHSTGRRDLLIPMAKAAIAVGADGIMAEVHPDPAVALSDSAQQMDIPTFEHFLSEVENKNPTYSKVKL